MLSAGPQAQGLNFPDIRKMFRAPPVAIPLPGVLVLIAGQAFATQKVARLPGWCILDFWDARKARRNRL
jgi:hypothetical protein